MTMRARGRRGISFLELLIVITILGVLAGIMVSRTVESGDDAKVSSCHVNKQNIEIQAQLWFRNKGTWPASNLSDIGTDTSYLPDGLPTCPVDGSAYTFDSSAQEVSGHTH